MTVAINIKLDGSIGAIIKKMSGSVGPASAKGVLRAANHAGGEIAQVVVEKFPGGTGQLAGSFLPATFVESTEGVAAGALSDLVHAGIQDKGGTIKPKTVKMLAVPISNIAKKMWPRDWAKDELTLITSKKDNLILAGIDGKKITPHYILKASVDIIGRNYVIEASQRARPRVNEIMNEELQIGVDSAVEDVDG